jgi:hypothetical protein
MVVTSEIGCAGSSSSTAFRTAEITESGSASVFTTSDQVSSLSHSNGMYICTSDSFAMPWFFTCPTTPTTSKDRPPCLMYRPIGFADGQ